MSECANILGAMTEPAQPVRIAIRVAGKVILTESSQIISIESRGNRVLVRTFFGSHLAGESVFALEQKLKPYGFVRIHRSTIVNETLVEEIRVSKAGAMWLRVAGADKEYSVSRKYRAFISRLAPAWF